MSWPMVKLGGLVSVKGGKRLPLGAGYSDIETPYSYIRVTDFENHSVNTSNVLFISEDVQQKIARYTISSEDVYISIAGSIGIVGIVPEELNGANLTENAAKLVITDKSTLDKNYLMRFLATAGQSQLQGQAKTTSQPKLALFRIEEVEIPLPPLAEQKRIAAILDKADAIRRKRQQAIQLADDFLRAVFLEMFGDPVTNPKGWEVKKLSEISTNILNGTTPKGGSDVYVNSGVQFLRSQNVWKNHIIYDDLVYLDDKTHKSMAKSSLKHKDILMTKTGRINTENSSLGRAALFLGEDNSANINGHVYLIRLKKDIIHEFVVFILTTTEYRDYIRSVCVGGIDKRQINKEHLEDFPIILPPKLLQEKFFAQLNQIRSFVGRATDSLADAEEMFNGLSHKAFSGQL